VGLVLGIDISTTATKAILVDAVGVVRGVGSSEYQFSVPRPLWSEQDPNLWWDGTVAAVGSVMASTGTTGADIDAIGLTGQMHGLVVLDAADRVLRPAILWNDQRTAAECDAIRTAVGPERLIAVTGNDALTGFTAPKLVWVRDHEPEVWRSVRHVLLPKDFVRFRLSGDYAIDKADGAGTILFDLAARDWSGEILDALRIERSWMPPTRRGSRGHRHSERRGGRGDWPAGGDPDRRRRRRPVGRMRSGSASSRRARWRSRSGPPASSSPRQTVPSTNDAASSMPFATPCPAAGT